MDDLLCTEAEIGRMPIGSETQELSTLGKWKISSQLESLPQELLWKVISFIPESVGNLRLTSRIMLAIVNNYIQTVLDIALVRQIIVKVANEKSAIITFHVELRNCCLFELRLKLRHPEFMFAGNLNRYEQYYGTFTAYKRYLLRLDVNNSELFLEKLKECIGWHAVWATAIYIEGANSVHFAAVSKILEGIKVGTFEAQCESLTDNTLAHILNVIKKLKILSLELISSRNEATNPVNFLMDAASLVLSIDIMYNGDSLFNLKLQNWSEIFIEMFSKKLETLTIASIRHHFSLAEISKLRKHLPRQGKKICFDCRCNCNRNLHVNYVENDHFVQADFNGKADGRLRIVHSSRVLELPPFAFSRRSRSLSTSWIEIPKLREKLIVRYVST